MGGQQCHQLRFTSLLKNKITQHKWVILYYKLNYLDALPRREIRPPLAPAIRARSWPDNPSLPTTELAKPPVLPDFPPFRPIFA